MAGQLSPVEQHDFSGGVNAVVNPFDAGPKQVIRASNLMLDEHGSMRTIDGTLILYTSPSVDAGSRILMPISWLPVGGSIQRLVITRPAAGSSKLYNYSTVPWTLIGTFVGNSSTPFLAILSNLMVWTDGYNTPRSWDGATFQALAGYPAGVGAQHIINHQGFLFTWNTRSTTTATDGPSVLRQSDLNQPTLWNAAQIVFVAKDDGTQGQGLALFTIAEAGIAPEDTLVLFKDRSSYQMIGNLGTGGGAPSTNFSLKQIKTDMGCYAPRTIQFASGFGIIRLTHRGFALFNGIDDRLISEEIRPYLFGRDDIQGIDWANVGISWGSQSQNPPIYIAVCPLSGTDLTRAFLYDLVRKAWMVIDLPFPVASISLVAESGTLPVVLLGDAPNSITTGRIRRWFAQDPDFDGTPVPWSVRSKEAGSPLNPHYFRRVLLNIIIDGAADASLTATFSGGIVKGPQSISLIQGTSPNLVTVDLDVNARHGRYDLSGTGRVRIRAHQWEVRRKPMRSTKV